MKYLKITTLMVLALFFAMSASAQNKFDTKIKIHHRDDAGFAYNFFVGEDAEDFQTSINGFGSGFLFDALAGRNTIDFIQIGMPYAYISLGAGLAITKFRFKDNLMFSLSGDGEMVNYEIDPNPDHDYVNTFLGYGKSKLVTSSIFLPAHLNFDLGQKFLLSAGGFVDFLIFTKQKRKYLVDDEKEKVLIKHKEFKDYNLNKIKYGVSASLTHKKTGMGLIGTYYLTPFFEEGKGPEINEARVTLVFSINPKVINRD